MTDYAIENVYRSPYELVPAAVSALSAIAVLAAPSVFLLTPDGGRYAATALALFAFFRWHQGHRIQQYRKQLKYLPEFSMKPSEVPQSHQAVYLGKGFAWTQRHTQRLLLAYADENRGLIEHSRLYRWIRVQEHKNPPDHWLTKLTSSHAWWNPFPPLPPVGGNPEIHGVEPDEEDIWTLLAELNNHVIVYGTTRVGKTRLAQILITQDIMRGDSVIVIDPKGDVELLLGMYADAIRAGRGDDFMVFHLGFPGISARYNPLGSFEQITEVASRATGPLPEEGQSSAFKAFAWRYVNVIARAMAAVGEKPDYSKIYAYGVNIDDLAKTYFQQWLDQNDEGWRDRFDPTPTKDMKDLIAKAQKNNRDVEVVMLTQYFGSRGHQDQVANSLISILMNDRTYFEKLVNSLYPLLEKLTTGELAKLISPDYMDARDPRPILDWMSVINRGGIVYVGLDALSIPDVAHAVGAAMLADLTTVAGSIYKHGSTYGMSSEGPKRRVRLHADELNEVLGPEFVPMVNKAGGAGVNVTGYTQTGQDIEAKVGSLAKAGQISGNLNTTIMLRVKNMETAEILTKQLPEVRVRTREMASGVSDTNDPTDFADFASRNEDRITAEKVPMLEPALLTKLPKGQAFCLLEGGRLYKIRMPLPVPEARPDVPSDWAEMLAHMKSSYAQYLHTLGENALTTEGKGIGF
jgi:conjugative coupling factor TraD (TOL family)